LEPVGLRKQIRLNVTVDLGCLNVLFISHITDALVEKQRENIPFPIGTIYSRSAQDICGFPET